MESYKQAGADRHNTKYCCKGKEKEKLFMVGQGGQQVAEVVENKCVNMSTCLRWLKKN